MAFLPGIGPGEWLVLLAVGLIVIGPRRLPQVARKIGRALEVLRRAADDFRRQLDSMDETPAAPPSDAPADSGPARSGERTDPPSRESRT